MACYTQNKGTLCNSTDHIDIWVSSCIPAEIVMWTCFCFPLETFDFSWVKHASSYCQSCSGITRLVWLVQDAPGDTPLGVTRRRSLTILQPAPGFSAPIQTCSKAQKQLWMGVPRVTVYVQISGHVKRERCASFPLCMSRLGISAHPFGTAWRRRRSSSRYEPGMFIFQTLPITNLGDLLLQMGLAAQMLFCCWWFVFDWVGFPETLMFYY